MAFVVWVAACMPEGDPPSGRQVSAARTDELVESGARTVLAAEFGIIAFVQPEAWDPDRAKPGAVVAFQFRARFASPYDGVWLTTLP